MLHSTTIKHVGLDVHAHTIEVAIAEEGGRNAGSSGGPPEVRRWGRIENRPEAVTKLCRQLQSDGRTPGLQFWYEAGPTGYGLFRQLERMGHGCHVVAPSLIPRKPGDRVKTDRRDATSLARLGRAGELTPVWVPGPEQEAMRDLSRCREDAKQMQRRARQRLNAFLLRHDHRYEAGVNKWTQRHFTWLAQQRFESPVLEQVFREYAGAVDWTTRHLEEIDRQLEQTAPHWSMWPVAQALMALRGVALVTAVGLVAELGDVTRFDSPRTLMAFVGLVPSERSSGPSRRQGRITKTGNGHVRRLLVESSWSYRCVARMTAHLKRKAAHAPPAAQDIAWKAQKRLCQRYRHLMNRGKTKSEACTAVARELVGFIWAIGCEVSSNRVVELESGVVVDTSGGNGGCSTPL